ncbi:MAG TPA: glycosyltransferase family 4 protein [Phototrophicaceae bacterium]|nr:glycosyltransferase family 4 protein [Phototrophicaceae bacterium]
MKIALFVNNIDAVGGAEIATRRLAEQFAQGEHQITLIGTQSLRQWRIHPQLIDYTKNIRSIRLPVWQRSRKTFRQMLLFHARWLFPRLKCDILHLRGLSPETLTLAAIARRCGMKTICVPMASGAYGDVTTCGQSDQPPTFDWISALTVPLREEVIGWGFPSERTGVIPNGVDTRFFHSAAQSSTAPNVIFVGQFRPEKCVNLLLTAWKIVQMRMPQARLTLVGGGSHLPEYEQLADQLGLVVTFIPNTDADHVLTQLQASSVFVLPGISEGMSNALLEAMAVGLAPVVADTPANRAVITPEINGICYPAESAETLADQLTRLLTEPALRERLGAVAHTTVEQHYTLASVADQYLSLYARLLGETP